MLNLSIIEQAIKDEMAAQIISGKWAWIREINTYGGEFDDENSTFIDLFPAIWVTFDGSKTPDKSNHNKYKMPLTFVVLCGARSVRNEEAQRHGAGGDIGTYQMIDYVQRLLAGNDLSSQGISGLAPLELGRIRTIFNTSTRSNSVSVLAQEFTTSYTIVASDRDRERDDPETPDMHSINIDYFFQPQDDVKDASDLVQLDHD